jgi:hypothetical protein
MIEALPRGSDSALSEQASFQRPCRRHEIVDVPSPSFERSPAFLECSIQLQTAATARNVPLMWFRAEDCRARRSWSGWGILGFRIVLPSNRLTACETVAMRLEQDVSGVYGIWCGIVRAQFPSLHGSTWSGG